MSTTRERQRCIALLDNALNSGEAAAGSIAKAECVLSGSSCRKSAAQDLAAKQAVEAIHQLRRQLKRSTKAAAGKRSQPR